MKMLTLQRMVPTRRGKWLAGGGAVVGLLALGGWGVWQQLHYAAYLPAGTHIGPLSLGQIKRSQVAVVLAAEAAKATVQFNVDGRAVTYPLADTGAGYDVAAVQRQLDQQARQPFFMTWLHNPPLRLPLTRDEAKVAAFAQRFATEQSHARQPARFSFEAGRVVVQEGKPPSTYRAEAVLPLLRDGLTQAGTTITIKPDHVTAANTPQQLAAARQAMQQLVDTPLSLSVGGTNFPTTAAERYGWLTATEQPTGDFSISVATTKLRPFVAGVAAKVYVAPTTTTVTLLDDAEQSRQAGKAGAALPIDSTVASLKTALQQHQAITVTAGTAPVASPVSYRRNYSRSAYGLSLLMRDFANERRLKLGIAMTDLNGSLSAGYNSGTRFVTASIFKTYLAYAVLNKVESGEFSFSSVAGKIDPMIVKSDNATAIDLHKLYGYTAIDPFLHSQGFTATRLNNYNSQGQLVGDKYTTAANTANLYARLASGTLLNATHTDYLIGLMKRQVYRSGLPSGSAPSAVADKVGFLGPYIHDAGIVYAPKGTYVLVVLTNGGTWADIAELSKRIYQLYNR